MKLSFDCVVVGCGISGMTAAIYLKRAGKNVLILDDNAPGGLLNRVNKIENYPGFDSISGPDLAYKVFVQITSLNIEYRYGKVIEINDHIIKTDLEEIEAKTIILATGRQNKRVKENVLNISYCALCDGPLYKDKIVAVYYNDDKAKEEIEFLSGLCKEVIVIGNYEEKGNIKVINSKIDKINIENNLLKSIIVDNNEIVVDGLFIYLGYEPANGYLNDIELIDGYIKVNDKMQTNKDYVFACGDAIKKDVYQIATAVGEASIAAINAIKKMR